MRDLDYNIESPRQPEPQLEKAVKIIDKHLRLSLPKHLRTRTGVSSRVTWKDSSARVYEVLVNEKYLSDETLLITELVTLALEVWQKAHGTPPEKKQRIYNSEFLRQADRSGLPENTAADFPHRFCIAETGDARNAANEITAKGTLKNMYTAERKPNRSKQTAFYQCPCCKATSPVLHNGAWIELLQTQATIYCKPCNRAYEPYNPFVEQPENYGLIESDS
jgi:hypothetical protein